nr:hypothetical protein [Tanacetum cinerariifolium]
VRRVRALDMQVTLHDKRIVMQVTLHYEFKQNFPHKKWKHSDAPIIEDWVSDDEEEDVEKQEVKPSINRINFVKATTDNNPKETVETGEQPKQNTHMKRGSLRIFLSKGLLLEMGYRGGSEG